MKVTQSCPTLCNPIDCTVYGILQARKLECIAIHFSNGSSQPRNQTQVFLLQVDLPAEPPGSSIKRTSVEIKKCIDTASQVALVVKNLPVNAGEIWVQSLGWEVPLEEGMATHSSILAWRIPWTEGPGGLRSIGSQRVEHDWSDLACSMRVDMYRCPSTPMCIYFSEWK